MNDILALPTGPLVDASLALVRSTESAPIADHSIRSFLFARLVADTKAPRMTQRMTSSCSSRRL
jgi:hypothetical protein